MWDKITFSDWEIIYRKGNSFENIENHEHIDYLHFIVNYRGYPILIDSGLASYVSNHAHANARNAEYHNSLLIDSYAYKPMKKKIFPDKYYAMNNSSIKTKTQTGYKLILKTSGFNRIDNNIDFDNTKIEFVNHSNELSNSDLNLYSEQYGTTQLKKVLNSKNIINKNNPIIHRINII